MIEKREFSDFYDKQINSDYFYYDADEGDDPEMSVEDFVDEAMASTVPIPTFDGTNRLDYVAIMKDYHSGDEKRKNDATEKVIGDLTGLVMHIIKKKYPNYSPKHFDDLVQSGEMGILIGLQEYDPEKSLPATFFYYYIVHEIQAFINSTVYRTTPYYSANMKKINRAIAKFESLDMPYTKRDISIQTGIPLDTVEKAMSMITGHSQVSLEAFGEQLEGPERFNPEEEFFKKENSEFLYTVMGDYLSDEESQILAYLYGIGDYEQTSLKNTAKILKMSIDKVKKLRTTAFCKLRNSPLAGSHPWSFRNDELELEDEDAIVLFPRNQAVNSANELQEIEIDF